MQPCLTGRVPVRRDRAGEGEDESALPGAALPPRHAAWGVVTLRKARMEEAKRLQKSVSGPASAGMVTAPLTQHGARASGNLHQNLRVEFRDRSLRGDGLFSGRSLAVDKT